MPRRITPIADRFWPKVARSGGCWQWVGTVSANGYGAFSPGPAPPFPLRKTGEQAHRVSWVITGHTIGLGLTLDHTCKNRLCVNPAHLELVPMRTNVLRNTGPTAENAVKDHCKFGHAFDEENTYLQTRPDGRKRRACRACKAACERERTQKRKNEDRAGSLAQMGSKEAAAFRFFGFETWHAITEHELGRYVAVCGDAGAHSDVEGAVALPTGAKICTNCRYPGRLKDKRKE